MIPVIAIVGRPNVGKSTLFNRLSRSRDALVDNRPGVTRDRLQAEINVGGLPVILVDTGGFDDASHDPLIKKVKDQVNTAIEEADRIIFMVDGRQGIMPGDEEIADILRRSSKQTYLAVNKADGPEHEHLVSDFYGLGMSSVYPVSAAHGYGVRAFMQNVVKGMTRSDNKKENTEKIRVAVLGKPNAGKSSLINRILGLDRMVVSDLPGTTRDTVDTPFFYRGKEYLLIDTAGIRKKAKVKEKIEKFSMIKAVKSLKRCHVAAVLLDASQGVSEQDARICGYAFEQGRAVLLVVNKWDLIKGDARKRKALEDQIDRQLHFVSFAPRIKLSALTGMRVMKIFEKIDNLYEQFSRRISTGAVNRAIKEMIEKHPPPRLGRGRLKFLYATQARTKPPTFVVFLNRPDMIHFSYERFIVNQLRERFQFDFTPIKVLFRKK
jgi:GTP-binding protein